MIKILILFCLAIFGFQDCGNASVSTGKTSNEPQKDISKVSNENNSNVLDENVLTENVSKDRNYNIFEMKHGALLGGVKNGKFINAEIAAKQLKIGEKLTLYDFGSVENKKSAKIIGLRENYDVCSEYTEVEVANKPNSGIAFGSGADFNPVPRVPQKLDANGAVYKKVVADFLKTKKINNPVVKIEQIFRVDLEGDGKDEVVIRATNYKNFGASENKGEYSFVLLRKIVGESVKDILLAGDFSTKDVEFSAPNTHEISAIADLNGDGKMEIVIYGQYYEGHWNEAYEITGEKANKVLQTGCGV